MLALLGTLLRKNTTILIAASVTILIARISSSIVLTRLLDATAFGIVGVITTVAMILVLFTDLGFYPFVVRSVDSFSAEFLDKVWTIRLIRSLALTIVCFFLAWPVALYVGVPGLEYAVAATALSLLLDGLSSMAFATGARDGKMLQLSLLDVIPLLFQVTGSIILALIFRSFWVIVAMGIISSALKCGLSYALFPGARRKWSYDPVTLKEVWAFGRHIMPSSIISLLINQGDKIVLARLFDLNTFGLYVLASNLASAPTGMIGSYTSRILYPAFANTHRTHPEAMRTAFYQTGALFRKILMFAFGGFIGSAPIIIALLYDDRYLPAIPFLQILAFCSLSLFYASTVNEALVASGRVKAPLYINITRLILIIVAGGTLYTFFGAIGFVFGFAVSLFITQMINWVILHRLKILNVGQEMQYLALQLLGFAVGSFVVYLSKLIFITAL